MAITTLPYPNMDFVPLDVLTADELDQIVANIEAINNAMIGTNSISNLAITGAKIADGAINTAKLANGAVDATKMNLSSLKGVAGVADGIGWTYLGSTVLTATSASLTFTAPTTYSNYKILASATLATGSNTWLDVRILNGTSDILNTHQVQAVDGTTWKGAVNTGVKYLTNLTSVNQYDGIDADVSVFGTATDWKKFHAYIGKAQNTTIETRISNGRNNSGTVPNKFQLITGGTFAVGSWIRVWGWD